MPCRCWRSGGTAALAWGSLAGSREVGWREMRFVNFAGSEGKLARNSSVNFKPSDPTYRLEKAGWNGIGRGRTLKNGPPRSSTASAGRARRNCGAGRRPDFEVYVPISCQPPSLFPAPVLSRPVHDRQDAGMWRSNVAEIGRAHLRVAGQLGAETLPAPAPTALMERAGRGLGYCIGHGVAWLAWWRVAQVYHTCPEARTGLAEAGGFEPTTPP